MKNYKTFTIVLFILVLMVISQEMIAQCPMCRMSAESNLENGGTAGKGLNTGILYLLSMPYLLIATIGFLWIKNRRKNKEEVLGD